MRTLPQVESMREAVGVCAEKGVPFCYSSGHANPDGMPFGFDLPAAMEVCKLLAKTGAEIGVQGYYTSADPTVGIMIRDYTRQGAILAGHPEMYKPDNITWAASSAIVFNTIGVFERNNCGAMVIWGDFGWAQHMPLLEIASRRGAFVIVGESWSNEGTLSAFFSDLISICEEQTVAGPYLSNNVGQMSVIFGEDVVKLGYMAFITILFVAALAGVKF